MQISAAQVTPVTLPLNRPARLAGLPEITAVQAVFVRLETRSGRQAWGCGVAHPELTGETPTAALRTCMAAADMAPDLHPTNLEYSLSLLAPVVQGSPAAACAFDLAFYDLLGLASDLPLYRLLGGFRNRILTSATVPLGDLETTVARACERAAAGFRIIKLKGGVDPELDVQRARAVRRALPHHTLRLDADGCYTAQQALDVARALKHQLEMLEQPTPPGDLATLKAVSRQSAVPVLADQSAASPSLALELAAQRAVSGLRIKVATCGGLGPARRVEAIARAAQITLLVGCTLEPALLIAAGLALALSSPNVRYGDLDGYLDLQNDPTQPGFSLQAGELIAHDTPGLGCLVNL